MLEKKFKRKKPKVARKKKIVPKFKRRATALEETILKDMIGNVELQIFKMNPEKGSVFIVRDNNEVLNTRQAYVMQEVLKRAHEDINVMFISNDIDVKVLSPKKDDYILVKLDKGEVADTASIIQGLKNMGIENRIVIAEFDMEVKNEGESFSN